MDDKKPPVSDDTPLDAVTIAPGEMVNAHGELVNSSGHVQEVDRTFGIFSVCAMAVISDNAWGAGVAALVVSLYNGGGPGVIYGLIAGVFFYSFIALGLAELASALPTSANVYHWASVTAGPRWGRLASFYAGWWNVLAWNFGVASVMLAAANAVVAMYSLYHPQYVEQRWHTFIAFVVINWVTLSLTLFGQPILAKATSLLGITLVTFWFLTLLVCAIMPSQTGYGYASSSFVWTDFINLTGWSNDGLVFLLGILNGAFTIGCPDGVTHICEEIPNPRRNVPLGILAQMVSSSITAFFLFIVLLYGITDLDAVFNGRITALPLAAIYHQITRSDAATFALLLFFCLDIIAGAVGGYVVAGRMLWTLARDDGVPYSSYVRKVDRRFRNPFVAQFICGIFMTIMGAIYVANSTAFTALVGSFTILTTWSYCAAMLPHLLSGRSRIRPGYFWMPSWLAYPVLSIACAYILIFNVLFMFPYSYPPTATSMNYACVLSGGVTILLTPWYLWKRSHGYEGPKVLLEGGHDDIKTGVVGLTALQEKMLREGAAH